MRKQVFEVYAFPSDNMKIKIFKSMYFKLLLIACEEQDGDSAFLIG